MYDSYHVGVSGLCFSPFGCHLGPFDAAISVILELSVSMGNASMFNMEYSQGKEGLEMHHGSLADYRV